MERFIPDALKHEPFFSYLATAVGECKEVDWAVRRHFAELNIVQPEILKRQNHAQ